MKVRQVYVYASAAAFYLFLSLIPTILVVCTVVSIMPFVHETDLIREVAAIPGSIPAFLIGLIRSTSLPSAGIISISAIAAIWSAGKGMQALTTGINAMNKDRDERSFLTQRLRACFYMILFLIIVLLLLSLKVFAHQLILVINVYLPEQLRLVEDNVYLKNWIPLVVMTVLFTAMYAYLPRMRKPFFKQIPGALFTACTWVLFTEGFTAYVEVFDGFASYGTMSTIIGLMLWMYFCCYLLLMGVYLNRFLEEERIWKVLRNIRPVIKVHKTK